MFLDCRGLPPTTVSEQAAAALDHAVDGYLGYRADMAGRMEALLAADPDFGLAHCRAREGDPDSACRLSACVLGRLTQGSEPWRRAVVAQLAFRDRASGRLSSTRSCVTVGVIRPRSPRSRRTRP
jgi:hypothetical protein